MGFNSAFNPFNAELNSICHLLALLGAHHIIHVSGVRVKGLRTEVMLGLHVDRPSAAHTTHTQR